MTRRWLWIALAHAACREPTPPAALAEPGTRLVPKISYFSGGAGRVDGWFDVGLEEECGFVPEKNSGQPGWSTAIGDTYYCLPIDGSFATETDRWLDPECTEPLRDPVLERIDGAPPAVAVYGEAWTTCGLVAVLEVGAPLDLYVKNGPSGCGLAGAHAYRAGATVPLERFVRLRVEASTEGAVSRVDLVGDDGSRANFGAWDRAHDAFVRPGRAGDGRLRWLPDRRVAYSFNAISTVGHAGGLFSSPTCETRVATKDIAPCLAEPTTVLEFVPHLCEGYRFEAYAIGPEVMGDEVHARDPAGECVAAPQGMSTRYYAMGPRLDLLEVHGDDFARGEGRIREVVRTTGPNGAGAVISTRFRDREYGTCVLEETPDGVTRCVPPSADGFGVYYLDEQCQQAALYEATKAGCPIDDPPRPFALSSASTTL